MLASAIFGVIAVSVACGDSKNGVTNGALDPNGGSAACGTPQMGCPCETPGARVACGKKLTGDFNFIYCFQGVRTCLPTGVYGDCTEGEVVQKSLSSIRPSALALTSTTCNGGAPGPISVCVTGRRQGEECLSGADCGPGRRKCTGGGDSTQNCKKNSQCDVACGQFNGECAGGPTPNIGCNVDADCGAGGTCTIAGGGGVCGTYTGVCNSSTPEDGDECNADADCGAGGNCEGGNKGNCLSGKNNGKKCKRNKHCAAGGGTCSADTGPSDSGVTALDR